MEKPEYKADYYEDRINLLDYIRVIWRRKFIIVGVIIVSVIAAILISFGITPVYRVSAALIPGAIEVEDKTGKRVQVDPIDDIVAYINGGIYNPQIFNSLNLDPFGLQFIAERPEHAYIINVYYETVDPEQGKVIVGELLNQIEKSYSWRIAEKKNEIFDNIEEILIEMVFRINNIRLLKSTENKIKIQIKTVDENTEAIRKQRDGLLNEGGDVDKVALLLYSNTIHQNIAYKDILNTELQNNRVEQVVHQQKIENSERKFRNEFFRCQKLMTKSDIVSDFKELLSKYEFVLEERPNIKYLSEKLKEAKIAEENSWANMIRVIQDPVASSKPIKPRRARVILISVVFSIFLGFFLALIIDFMKKNKTSSKT